MTDRFEVHILPIPHYAKYKSADYTLAIIQFDVIQNCAPYDNGYGGCHECCDKGLQKIVETADKFLAGELSEDDRLTFEIPYIVGGHVKYGYCFDIHVGQTPEENYWVFNDTKHYDLEDRKPEYSYKLSRSEVACLRESLVHQIAEFDWENCGKTEYFTFSVPEKSYDWCYSAKELEAELNDLLLGDKLLAIYVSGTNFADPLRVKENYVNYYVGSQVYLEFERKHIDILAHAAGLFQYRFFDRDEVSKERFFDELDNADQMLCDTGYVFQLQYRGETVHKIIVAETDCWPWAARGFDKRKLGSPIELPESISILLGNGNRLSIIGYDDDFALELFSVPTEHLDDTHRRIKGKTEGFEEDK